MVTHCYCSKTVSPYKDMAHVLRLLHLREYKWESWNHWKDVLDLPTDVNLSQFFPPGFYMWMWWSLGLCLVERSWCWTGQIHSAEESCDHLVIQFFSNVNLRINPYFGLYSLSNSVCNHFRGSTMHRMKNLSLVIFYLEKRSFRFAFVEDIYGEEFHFGQILNLKHRRLNHKVCAERFGLKTELEGKCMAFQ